MAEKEIERPEPAESVREATQLITKSLMEAQQRNMKFVENTFTNAIELLKSHGEATRALMQELEKQQANWQKLAPEGVGGQWMENYMAMLRGPFSFYQQSLETVEKTTQQGLQTFQKAVEEFEEAARRPEHPSRRVGKA